MKILALDTSSTRGSVALLDGSNPEDVRVVGYRRHEVENEHAERLLGLVDEVLAEANWPKSGLERVAVGVGPGSFTGVRIGIALAQGLMLGLGVVGVGVGSLAAVAAGLSSTDGRNRVVLRDARRQEYFVAVYSADGEEVVAPFTVLQAEAREVLEDRFFAGSLLQHHVLVGTELVGLPFALEDETRHPDARAVGRLGCRLDPRLSPVTPRYVRGPQLVRPNLVPSPLSEDRRRG